MAITLIVEDGSNVANANTYISLEDWQSYWLLRGIDVTQHGHDESHKADITRAFDAINRNWRYLGIKSNETQVGQWPREIGQYIDGYWVETDEIPQDIINAQAELAYLIHEGATPFATLDAVVGSAKVKAGPVESETTYLGGKGRPQYTAVNALLRPYVIGGAGQVRLLRA